MIANLVFFMFVAMRTKANPHLQFNLPCTNYTGSVCRDVIGSGPVRVDLELEALFEDYKSRYTDHYVSGVGVNVDAQCEAFLRAQFCGLVTSTCTDQVHCGAYDNDEIGRCGAKSCKCSGGNFRVQQVCNEVLRDLFAANGGGRDYYKRGQQPQGKNCTTFNIPCPSAPTSATKGLEFNNCTMFNIPCPSAPTSAAMGLKFPLIGLLATAVITSLGVMLP